MKKKEVHVELFGGETQLFEEKVLKYTKITDIGPLYVHS